MESPRHDLIAPQHLDRALYVTTPKAWLALFMLLVMAAALGDTVTEGVDIAEIHDEATMERYTSALALTEEHRQTLREREAEAQRENALSRVDCIWGPNDTLGAR